MDARCAAAEGWLSSIVGSDGPQLLRFFRGQVSQPSEAENLVQAVYLRVLKFERRESIRCPRAYLFRIAANIAREYWLKRSSLPLHVPFEDVHRMQADDCAERRPEWVYREALVVFPVVTECRLNEALYECAR